MRPSATATQEQAYALAADLLQAIAADEPGALSRFGITPNIRAEIHEVLAQCDLSTAALRLPPKAMAFQAGATGRTPFDLYPTQAGPQRLECLLWSATGQTKLTLLADLVPNAAGDWQLSFCMLELQ